MRGGRRKGVREECPVTPPSSAHKPFAFFSAGMFEVGCYFHSRYIVASKSRPGVLVCLFLWPRLARLMPVSSLKGSIYLKNQTNLAGLEYFLFLTLYIATPIYYVLVFFSFLRGQLGIC